LRAAAFGAASVSNTRPAKECGAKPAHPERRGDLKRNVVVVFAIFLLLALFSSCGKSSSDSFATGLANGISSIKSTSEEKNTETNEKLVSHLAEKYGGAFEAYLASESKDGEKKYFCLAKEHGNKSFRASFGKEGEIEDNFALVLLSEEAERDAAEAATGFFAENDFLSVVEFDDASGRVYEHFDAGFKKALSENDTISSLVTIFAEGDNKPDRGELDAFGRSLALRFSRVTVQIVLVGANASAKDIKEKYMSEFAQGLKVRYLLESPDIDRYSKIEIFDGKVSRIDVETRP
jgi:hypothetical protein